MPQKKPYGSGPYMLGYCMASCCTSMPSNAPTAYAQTTTLRIPSSQIFVDNQGAIQLAKNPKFHERTKHISVLFHFVHDACERNAIKTTYLPTSEMLADSMTKNFPRGIHWKHIHGLGLVSRDSGEVSEQPRVKRWKYVTLSVLFFGGCTLSSMSVVFPSRGFLHGYEF